MRPQAGTTWAGEAWHQPGWVELFSGLRLRAWCDGFLVGLDVKSLPWIEPIEEDAAMRRVLCPIIALSTRFGAVLESAGRTFEDDADEEELEAMLPGVVLAAYNWWRRGEPGAHFVAASATANAAA